MKLLTKKYNKNPLLTFALISFLLVLNTQLYGQEKKKNNLFKQLFGVTVNEAHDKFEGTTTYQMNGNRVFSELSGGNALVNLIFSSDHPTFNTFLNLEKYVKKDDTYELAILLKVEAENELWVRVMEGESLIFLLDDERIELETSGSFNMDYDMMKNTSVANARYPITIEQLEQINNTENIEFRIVLDSSESGTAEDRDKNDLHLDGKFNKKNKKVWIEFYDDYM